MIKSYKKTISYKYANDVISGKILASKYIIRQAERYLDDLENDDYYFDYDEHQRINNWFQKVLYVPELRRTSPLLPPHAFVLHQLYCIKRVDTGYRKHTKIYGQFARKQAKTYLAAGIGLYELILGSDPFPEVMTGANSRDQAVLCTKMMGRLVRSSPLLKDLSDSGELRVFNRADVVEKITYRMEGDDNLPDKDGMIIAMSRDEGDGGNPSVTVIDELHEAKNLSLLETMESGQALREQPLQIIITSCGHDKDAPCYTVLRKTALHILDGSLTDESFLPILYELDEEEEWDNMDMMIKSNPMLPYFPTLESYLEKRINQAKNEGGETEVNIKIKNCGVWVDAATTWIPSEIVKANNYDIKDDELIGKDCYIGFDLARSEDLNSLALFFPNVRDNIHVVKMVFWIPSDKVKNHNDHVDYRRWINEGLMIEQQGNVADHIEIAKDIIRIIDPYKIKKIGYDSKYAIHAVLPMLADAGYELEGGIGQGFALSPATVQVNEWMRKNQMDLMHHKVLYWNLANVIMKVGDQGDYYPSKGKSGNKIDGVSAMLTAITAYLDSNSQQELQSTISVW